MRRVAPRRGERGFSVFSSRAHPRTRTGRTRGFCMGFVPASSRDRLTWTGNESRGMRGRHEKISRTRGCCRLVNRVCGTRNWPAKSSEMTLVSLRDARLLNVQTWTLRMKGSVAQLVVRQIPALKVASSILAWVIFCRLITHTKFCILYILTEYTLTVSIFFSISNRKCERMCM